MRVKVKGQKWADPSESPIALELTSDEKAMIAAAPPHQSRFVFGDQPLAGWVGEENPEEPKEFKEVKEKEPVSAASATVPPVKKKAPAKKSKSKK